MLILRHRISAGCFISGTAFASSKGSLLPAHSAFILSYEAAVADESKDEICRFVWQVALTAAEILAAALKQIG